MVMEESNLTCALDYLKTLHFNNCHKYVKDALQSYKAVGLCNYERDQRMKSMILLMKVQSTPKLELNVAYITLIHIHILAWTPQFFFSVNLSLIFDIVPSIFYFSLLIWPWKEATCYFNPIKPLQGKILILALQNQIWLVLVFNKKNNVLHLWHCHCLIHCCWVLWTWNNH